MSFKLKLQKKLRAASQRKITSRSPLSFGRKRYASNEDEIREEFLENDVSEESLLERRAKRKRNLTNDEDLGEDDIDIDFKRNGLSLRARANSKKRSKYAYEDAPRGNEGINSRFDEDSSEDFEIVELDYDPDYDWDAEEDNSNVDGAELQYYEQAQFEELSAEEQHLLEEIGYVESGEVLSSFRKKILKKLANSISPLPSDIAFHHLNLINGGPGFPAIWPAFNRASRATFQMIEYRKMNGQTIILEDIEITRCGRPGKDLAPMAYGKWINWKKPMKSLKGDLQFMCVPVKINFSGIIDWI